MADGSKVASGAAAGATAGSALGPIGTAIGGIAGAVAGIFGAFKGGGGGTTSSGFTIPPEEELQYINAFNQHLQQIHQDYQRVQDLANAYSTKLSALDQIVGGGDKNQALQALQESNYRIATQMGASAEDLVKGGFITADDKADIDKLSKLAGPPDQMIQDPTLEKQINDNRARLEQDLRRQGASPASVAQALGQFDISANQARFNRTQDLRQTQFGQLTSLIGTRSGLRQQGFGQTQSTLGQNLGFAGQALGLLSESAQGQLAAQAGALSAQQGLRGEETGQYQDLGKFKLSKTTQRLFQTGQIGPGSIYSQTGISQNTLIPYSKFVLGRETEASKMGTPSQNTSLSAYQQEQQQKLLDQQRAAEEKRRNPLGL